MIRTIPPRNTYILRSGLLRRKLVNTVTRLARWKCVGPCGFDESFAVFKQTKIGERITNQFRVEIQNPLNRTVFGNPTMDFTSAAFGRISSTQIGPRNIQLGMKLIF